MNLEVKRNGLEIRSGSGSYNWADIDVAFIEEVLGLRNEGDFVRLVRKDAHGLNSVAYLETKTEEQYQSDLAWKERMKQEEESK